MGDSAKEKIKPISIDGSVLEGGGQIIRVATALSAILGKPIEIYNIRKNRKRDGLKNQHVQGLEVVRMITDGILEGNKNGSREVIIRPGKISVNGTITGDCQTAGSIALMLQVALPVLLYAPQALPTKLILKGGTNCDLAPQIEYIDMVLRPYLKKFGIIFDVDVRRRGYFPKGGGEVELNIWPISGPLKAVDCTDPGDIVQMTGYSFAAGGLPLNVAQVMAAGASANMKASYPCEVNIKRVKEPPELSSGSAAGILLAVEFSAGCYLGADALLQKNSRAELLGVKCAKELVKVIGLHVTVDEYMQDQLIIFMALAKGKSRIRCHKLSLHAETAIYICEKLTKAKFRISLRDSGTTIIECEGIGWSPNSKEESEPLENDEIVQPHHG